MTTTGAEAQRKKAAAPKPDPAIAATNNAVLFVSDAFQPWTPRRAVPAAKGKK